MLHDPTYLNLRKAARAAVVMPGVFAIAQYGFDDPDAALFASFAAFSALAMADFGGPRPRRFVAYVTLGLIGMALVAAGTVVSRSTVLAAAAMVVVAMTIVLTGAVGGYWEVGAKAAMLAFVLAATIEAPNSQLGSREIGWLLGAGAAALAAVVLWPGEERHPVRTAAAAVAATAATALTQVTTRRTDPSATATARAAFDQAADAFGKLTGIVYRPIGTTRADRGLKLLVIDIRRIIGLTRHVVDTEHPPTPDDDALITETAAVLDASAWAIVSPVPEVVDTDALVRARDEHRRAIDASATVEGARGDTTAVMTRVAAAFPLRRLSLLSAALAYNAEICNGAPPRALARDDAVRTLTIPESSVRSSTARATTKIGAHLTLHSVRFRNALRSAIGLGSAVLLAKALNLEHGFWVVLGTLTVLRSNAIGTRRTAVQALIGTVVGFALASALITVIGSDTTGLWIAFPVLAFLSAYTPAAVNFVVGQACFTVLVVALFNLVIPEGWRTGLVRVQDIAIGAGISLIVAFALWPRGAEGVVSETFADLLDTDARHLGLAIEGVLGGSDGPARDDVLETAAARDRALEALDALAAERGIEEPDAQPWAALLRVSTSAEHAAVGIARDVAAGPPAPACRALRHSIVDEGRRVETELHDCATQARHARRLDTAPPADDDRRAAPPDPGLADALMQCSGEAGHTPVELLWAREWLEHLGRVLEHTRMPSAGEQVSL